MPAIQPFSSSPPTSIRQHKKVLPSGQLLLLRLPSVLGRGQELPRHLLLLLRHLRSAQGWCRDLGREGSSDLSEDTLKQSIYLVPGPATLLLPPAPPGRGTGCAWAKQGAANRQTSSFVEIWSTALLQQNQAGLLPPARQQLVPKQGHFPPCSQGHVSRKGTLEHSCPTTSSEAEETAWGHGQGTGGFLQGCRTHSGHRRAFSWHSAPKHDV